MFRNRFPIFLSLVALVLLVSASQPSAPLQSRIQRIMEEQEASKAFWGIYVQEVETGRVIYSENADKTFLPASTQKILTSAGALDALGSNYRYQTTLFFDGKVDGDVLRGDLIIRGSGDPSFGSAFAVGPDPLRSWARSLAEMGVRRIEGRIIGDDDAFDDNPYAEGWDIDYLMSQSSRLLGISTSGLSYNDNLVELKIEAGRSGEPPSIRVRPANYLILRNNLTTSTRSRGISVRTSRIIGTETLDLGGSLPRTYNGTIVMPVTNPTAFTVHCLGQYLEEAGVEVTAQLVDIDELEEKPNYSRDKPLFVHVSPPLSRILEMVNKESNNFYAEQVFRSFSWGGSAEGGERRIKDLLSRAGASTEGISVRDGSGLSRKDMITPEAMGRLLVHMQTHREREAFMASLARGGESSSTLRHRLNNLPVEAKTGSLEFVRALSGYARTTDGRTLAFAVFANNYSVPSYRITQTIDRIVMELAGLGREV